MKINFIFPSALVSIVLISIVLASYHAHTICPSGIKSTKSPSSNCTSCSLLEGKITTIGGILASTRYFQARQDYEIPIPGFIIISSQRHVQSLDEFSTEERHDFIDFVASLRGLMREKLQINHIYMIQEEDACHFHLWLFPRYDWMKKFGNKIVSVKPIMAWAKENFKTPHHLEIVATAAEKIKADKQFQQKGPQ